MNLRYTLTLLIALVVPALFTHCSSNEHSTKIKLDLRGLSPEDTLLSIRCEGDTSTITQYISMTPPRFKKQIMLESPKFKKAIVHYANGAYALPLELREGETVGLKIDLSNPLIPQIKGKGFNATLAAFIQFAQTELQAYQNSILQRDASNVKSSLRALQERCLEYCLSHNDAEGVAKLSELYLDDPDFWRQHLQTDWPIVGRVKELQKALKALQPGSKAPDFSVLTSLEEQYMLSWQLPGYVVLTFTAQVDSASIAYINKLSDSLQIPKSLFVQFTQEPSYSGSHLLKHINGEPWTLVSDSILDASKVMKLYHIQSVPSFVVVDTAGYIR